MKKLYLYALTVSALLISPHVKSQCGDNPAAFPFIYSTGCFVAVSGALANADITVYDDLDQINTTIGQTDADGIGSVFYDCSRTITRILLTRSDGTVCEIGPDRIAAPAQVTPITLSSFSASVKDNNTATLTWTSELEVTSDKYVVERSTDGNYYTAIGEISAAGHSVSKIRYSFNDPGLGEQAVFYRLKMVDIDGKFEYSKVAYVNNRKGVSGSLKVFPNPFRSDVQLMGISTADVNRNNIRLYTITGKAVNFTITGANAITIDAGAAPGIYVLRVKDKTFRLVKE